MYWEEFWDHVVSAANLEAEENNAERKFTFMLHADKKSAANWTDAPIPFPDTRNIPKRDKSGISQLPSKIVIHRQ